MHIRNIRIRKYALIILLVMVIGFTGCVSNDNAMVVPSEVSEINDYDSKTTTEIISETVTEEISESEAESETESTVSLSEETDNNTFEFRLENIPEYSGSPYFVLNENVPLFEENEKNTDSFAKYSELDELGRCGVAFANISPDTIPTEERGTIGDVQPSGWHTVKYNDLIDGNYLYNRCHLIGYQLAGENDNPKNLITGTRYLNVQGMLPFENSVYDYVQATENHVLYRVTPVFKEDNLVASGVTIEAYSVEDEGAGICFYVFVYNVQPGIIIDYLTGESMEDPDYSQTETESELENQSEQKSLEIVSEETEATEQTYILNTNTHKFHRPTCKSVDDIKEKNKKTSTDSRDSLIEQGYSPCKRCNP